MPLLGETLSFLRNPLAFVEERVEQHGPVFLSNVLGQLTVFACNRATALDALCAAGTPCGDAPSTEQSALEAGTAYAEFLGPLFPKPNVLLLKTGSATRERLVQVFSCALEARTAHAYRGVVARVAERHLIALIRSRATSGDGIARVALYATLKPVCERLVSTVVLGEELGEARAAEVRTLSSSHFAGVVAAPVQLRALGRRTARARALDARERLLVLIAERVAEVRARPTLLAPSCILDALVSAADELNADPSIDVDSLLGEHVLLLLSAAVSKSIASALCSLFAEMSAARMEQPREIDVRSALVETLRLHPPLLGGMRVTVEQKEARIGGLNVPPRHRVWWSARHANRDKTVYNQPDEFQPARWTQSVPQARCPFASVRSGNEEPSTPLTFGAGERMCPGRFVAWAILEEVAQAVVREFDVLGRKRKDGEMRYLPVCRPVDDIVVEFRCKV